MPPTTRRIDSATGSDLLEESGAYTPIACRRLHQEWTFGWADIGCGPFEAPFFAADLRERLREQAVFFTREDDLIRYARRFPGIAPTGLVFHMSRCGSTLARRMLGTVESAVVLSEPPLINDLLEPVESVPPSEQVEALLGAALSTMARPDADRLDRFYLKCTSWNVLLADRFRRAALRVLWIFLHRDPVEVLVALERTPPAWAAPDSWLAQLLGIDPGGSDGERIALILRAYLEAAVREHGRGGGRLVAYPHLVEQLVDGDLVAFLGLDLDARGRAAMRAVARQDSKRPERTFKPDARAKRRRASPAVRATAKRILGPIYNRVVRLG